jgi:uncharacterized protein (DUF2235 family)
MSTLDLVRHSEFLSESDIQTMTGYVQHSKQIAQLRKMSVAHTVNAHGKPVVMRNWIVGQTQAAKWSPKVRAA